MTATLHQTAKRFITNGLCALPARVDEKRPIGTWEQYQTEMPAANNWSSNATAVCIVTGTVSGNLELIDFDHGGESFAPWKQLVIEAMPGLFERLVVEGTQSGGYHVTYRCEGLVEGNQPLAKRIIETPNGDEVTIHGKRYRPRHVGGKWQVEIKLVETRGQGGLFLCDPSPGYQLIQGSFDSIATITEDERLLLLDLARSLNEAQEPAFIPAITTANGGGQGERPGDDYNRRGDVRAVLRKHGWNLVRSGTNEYWRRPGKTGGWSATLKDGSFYVFTGNAPPFEQEKVYGPFAVLAMLDHNGDFAAAAAALRSQGYGGDDRAGVSLAGILGQHPQKNGNTVRLADETPAKQAKKRVSSAITQYQPLPVDVFPGIVADFIHGTAEAINVDPAFVALPTLAVMASAIGSTRQLLLKRGYAEPAVVWCAVVAESGTKKSPALDAPCRAVIKQEMANLAAYEEHRHQYEAALVSYKAALADWQRSGMKKGEPAPDEPEAPICKRFIVNDITVEALAGKLKDNPRGLLSKHDELSGLFGSMNQYRANGKGNDEAKYLSMFGARELIVDRKSSGSIIVPRAFLGITGSIQPAILKRVLTREHFESGMSARFLLAYPPPRVSTWTEDEVSEQLEQAFADTIQKLQRLDFGHDDDGNLVPIFCPLTTEAKARWVEFYNANAHETARLTGDLSAAWSKLTGYAARFAMVIRFAKWAQSNNWEQPNNVDLDSIEAGIKLAQWCQNETKRVYDYFAESPDDRDHRELVDLILRNGGSITARDLHRARNRTYASADEAEQVLQGLVESGDGIWQPIPTTEVGGRPTRKLCIVRSADETPVTLANRPSFVSSERHDPPKPDEVVHRLDDKFDEQIQAICESQQTAAAVETHHCSIRPEDWERREGSMYCPICNKWKGRAT